MGPEGAVNILYRNELKAAAEPDLFRAERVEEFRSRFSSPFIAAQRGFVDEIIRPRTTRMKLIQGLRMLENKKDTVPARKHGNIPL
jgi:acetyl-CoA carboxylase carboxyltransferase component